MLIRKRNTLYSKREGGEEETITIGGEKKVAS
jgi:hypothetical protein